MPHPLQPEPRPADISAPLVLARLALQASRTVHAQAPAGDWNRSARAPWSGQAGDLPGYVPGFGSTAWTPGLLRLTDAVTARHRATPALAPDAAAAPELAAAGVQVYAEKVIGAVPGRDPLDLWEQAARFGAGSVVAGARSLAAAVLTVRGTAGWQWRHHMPLLEALRRHWLVDWTLMGDQLFPAGPADHPQLLAALGEAIDGCCDLAVRPVTDAPLRARLWEAIAGPGPEVSPLHRRQIGGHRVLLLDLADPYHHERSRTLPTWTASSGSPEEALLASLAGELQLRVEGALDPQDRAVLHCYLAGERTWAQAAAEAAPGNADPAALGERVRRMVRRVGREQQRRASATVRVANGSWAQALR